MRGDEEFSSIHPLNDLKNNKVTVFPHQRLANDAQLNLDNRYDFESVEILFETLSAMTQSLNFNHIGIYLNDRSNKIKFQSNYNENALEKAL